MENNAATAPALIEEYSLYEHRRVVTSERKMDETQRETVPSVVDDVAQFLQAVGAGYTTDDSAQYGDALYGAMNNAGSAMSGLGPADTYPFPQLHSVTSAGSFYTHNVSQAWKEFTAAWLGVDWQDPLVMETWKNDVTDGQNMDEDMLEAGSTGLRANGWLSPDDRMAVSTASSRDQGTTDFFLMCHVVSLAPEWYPDGLVNLNPSPIPPCIRPVSFDGMTSPLWVQQPPDQHAQTGGGALETLTKNSIPLSSCLPLQSYIVTDDMTTALNASPSVNLYSVNTSLAASGGTPANQQMGAEQRAIITQVRGARTLADKGFETLDQAQVEPAVMPAASSANAPLTVERATHAVRRKRSYASIDELKSQMEAWAKAGMLENRGQRFPSERFEREAKASPERAAEIVAAATELLGESSDPRVLLMVAQLGRDNDQISFYEALLSRLETGVPDGEGIRSRTLREDLLKRLAERIPATDANLAPRAHALLKKEGRPEIRLGLLNHADPAGETVDTLADVCRGDADPSLVALSAARLAERSPDLLLKAATHIARQKGKTRDLSFRAIQRMAPAAWIAQHEAELKQLLKVQ